MGFTGNFKETFAEVDTDGSGVISLDEIDKETFYIWSQFKRWLGSRYTSVQEMFKDISGPRLE